MVAARRQNTSASLDVDPALNWHICVHTGGGRGYCPFLTGLTGCERRPLYSLGENALLDVLFFRT